MTLADGARNAPQHFREFQLENVLKLVRAKRFENDDFVQPVHKLRGKLSPRRLGCSTLDFVVEVRVFDGRLYGESETTLGEPAHF